jgi:amidase
MALTGLDVYRAAAVRSAWFQHVLGLFERHDCLVLPTAQCLPFDAALHWPATLAGRPMDSYHRWMEVVAGVTLAGVPAISVPAGFSDTGLPIGMQLIGRPQGDAALLRLAHAYDAATRWVARRPPTDPLTGDPA